MAIAEQPATSQPRYLVTPAKTTARIAAKVREDGQSYLVRFPDGQERVALSHLHIMDEIERWIVEQRAEVTTRAPLN